MGEKNSRVRNMNFNGMSLVTCNVSSWRPLQTFPRGSFCPSLVLSGVLDICSCQVSDPWISKNFSSKVGKRIKDIYHTLGVGVRCRVGGKVI